MKKLGLVLYLLLLMAIPFAYGVWTIDGVEQLAYGTRDALEALWSGTTTIWCDDNDGVGSGLDADLLDGQEGIFYLDCANQTGVITYAFSQDFSVTGVSTDVIITNFNRNVFDITSLRIHTLSNKVFDVDYEFRIFENPNYKSSTRSLRWVDLRSVTLAVVSNASNATTIYLDPSRLSITTPDLLYFTSTTSNSYTEISTLGAASVVVSEEVTITTNDYAFMVEDLAKGYSYEDFSGSNNIYGRIILDSAATNTYRIFGRYK